MVMSVAPKEALFCFNVDPCIAAMRWSKAHIKDRNESDISLSNVAAIKGYAEFKCQKTADGLTPTGLTAEIARKTAVDASVPPDEIDGLLVATPGGCA